MRELTAYYRRVSLNISRPCHSSIQFRRSTANSSESKYPHEKINQCLTDISRYLTDTENQFSKILVVSVKYRLYRLNIGLLRFLP